MQTEACNFTKNNTPPVVFFTFFKLYKWYQIAQSITFNDVHNTCILIATTECIISAKHFDAPLCQKNQQNWQ